MSGVEELQSEIIRLEKVCEMERMEIVRLHEVAEAREELGLA